MPRPSLLNATIERLEAALKAPTFPPAGLMVLQDAGREDVRVCDLDDGQHAEANGAFANEVPNPRGHDLSAFVPADEVIGEGTTQHLI